MAHALAVDGQAVELDDINPIARGVIIQIHLTPVAQWQQRAKLTRAVEVARGRLHPRVISIALVVNVALVHNAASCLLSTSQHLLEQLLEDAAARHSPLPYASTSRRSACRNASERTEPGLSTAPPGKAHLGSP